MDTIGKMLSFVFWTAFVTGCKIGNTESNQKAKTVKASDESFAKGPKMTCPFGGLDLVLTVSSSDFSQALLTDNAPAGETPRVIHLTRGTVEERDGKLIEGRWNFTDISTKPSVVIQAEAFWDKTTSLCRVFGYNLTPAQRTRAIAGKPLGVCVNYLERDKADTRSWRLAGYKDKETHELCCTMQGYLNRSRGNINNVLWCEKKTKVDLKQDLTNPKVFSVPEGCVEVPIE